METYRYNRWCYRIRQATAKALVDAEGPWSVYVNDHIKFCQAGVVHESL